MIDVTVSNCGSTCTVAGATRSPTGTSATDLELWNLGHLVQDLQLFSTVFASEPAACLHSTFWMPQACARLYTLGRTRPLKGPCAVVLSLFSFLVQLYTYYTGALLHTYRRWEKWD